MGYMELSSGWSGDPGLALLIHVRQGKKSGLSLSECRMLEEAGHPSDERVLKVLRQKSLRVIRQVRPTGSCCDNERQL